MPIIGSRQKQDIYFQNDLNSNVNLNGNLNLSGNVNFVYAKEKIFTKESLKQFYLAEGIILSLILLVYLVYRLWRR